MVAQSAITVRTNKKKRKQLESLAKTQDRSLNYVVNAAIDAYLDYQQWSVEEVGRGLAEADQGELVPHEEVVAELGAKVKKLKTASTR